MNRLPYLKNDDGQVTLMVDDKPFLILGGELHNSSGSDLQYMEEHVWPGLRKLGGNCYLTPVYWECMEPEEGVYDFNLVEGVISQARREGVRLILLWFGLWKNGASQYVPAWMKKDPEYFYMCGVDGRMVESVSPFCKKAVEADKKAFTELMRHLKEYDPEHTVIMMQVENETGIWGQPRDYCTAAQEAFEAEIPEEMAELYGVAGTWETAFGQDACEYFMAWALSKAVGEIAAAGRKEYDLPMFMNCVAIGLPLRAGQLPSGGPLPRVHKIWRRFAPDIDLYGPDIYSPFYKEVSGDFAGANALFIPELSQDKNSASKALYTVAAYNTICFSPFGIDGMMNGISENDLLAQTNSDISGTDEKNGLMLAEAYRILHILWEEIRMAQKEGNVFAFLQQTEPGTEFVLDDYILNVTYGDGGMRGHMGQPGHRDPESPIGGGFVLRRGKDRFLICGIACNVQISPAQGSRDQIFILEKREMECTENGLRPRRILNGDERNFTAVGAWPAIQEITFYRR